MSSSLTGPDVDDTDVLPGHAFALADAARVATASNATSTWGAGAGRTRHLVDKDTATSTDALSRCRHGRTTCTGQTVLRTFDQSNPSVLDRPACKACARTAERESIPV